MNDCYSFIKHLITVVFHQANYKISIIRLRHEIEDLRRRVEAMQIKVEAEKKVGKTVRGGMSDCDGAFIFNMIVFLLFLLWKKAHLVVIAVILFIDFFFLDWKAYCIFFCHLNVILL